MVRSFVASLQSSIPRLKDLFQARNCGLWVTDLVQVPIFSRLALNKENGEKDSWVRDKWYLQPSLGYSQERSE